MDFWWCSKTFTVKITFFVLFIFFRNDTVKIALDKNFLNKIETNPTLESATRQTSEKVN